MRSADALWGNLGKHANRRHALQTQQNQKHKKNTAKNDANNKIHKDAENMTQTRTKHTNMQGYFDIPVITLHTYFIK